MIVGMSHIGISVVNLERSLHFYRDLLGMEVVAQEEFGGEQYEAILALRNVQGRVALLKRGTFQVELFEFSKPVPAHPERERPVSDHGISHFCIEVEDIEETYTRLKSAGVPFHCPPLVFFRTEKATYGRDPDGNAFELFQPIK
jgi:glyoxylase I family protein